MRRGRLSSYLGLLFTLAVLLPSVVLVLIALRAVSQEEATVEKRLRSTLLAEVIHAVDRLAAEIDSVGEALLGSSSTAIPAEPPDSASPSEALRGWRDREPLAGLPFLVSSEFEILWPDASAAPLDAEERLFLSANRGFFRNQATIPIYRNIAVAYQEEILDQADTRYAPDEKRQQAIAQYETQKRVREKVYRQAEELGNAPQRRNVIPDSESDTAEDGGEGGDGGDGRGDVVERSSMFVAEHKTLEDITAEGEWGLFPRMHAGRLSLFFWSRRADGGILGCAVDDEALRRELLAALPGLHTAVRLLTLLDEMGVPLTTLPDDTELDLRRPFVAREVGPLLPRWEVAAYLSDPHIVASRAGVVKTAIGALVLLLFVSMATGGFLVLRSLRSEMTLARQRTTFVTNVSHELKTPLTSIRLYAEMLKNYEGTSREKRRRYLATMVAECERLTRLINNVLDFSKTERTERRYSTGPVDVTGLCRELVESQRTRLEQAGFRVRFRGAADDTTEPQRSDGADGSDGPLVVEADDQAVIQAVINLLSNAEKYSGDNREIDVSVYRRDNGPQSRPRAVIDIMDRGIGVPPSDRQRIFKQFYRVGDDLTAAVTGTGLGLTIARRQVRDQGGDIECLDRPGGGTIFRIRLPLPEQRES